MKHSPDPSWTMPSPLSQQSVPRAPEGATSRPGLRRWGSWLAATLLFSLLMFSFLGVLQEAVARGDQQRLQVVEQAQAELQCSKDPSLAVRRSCLADLASDRALASLR